MYDRHTSKQTGPIATAAASRHCSSRLNDPTPLVRLNHVAPAGGTHHPDDPRLTGRISPNSGFNYTKHFADILGDGGPPQI